MSSHPGKWFSVGASRLRGRREVLLAAMVFAAGAATWVFGYHTSFRALGFPDACDYAQLGRQLHRGEGFSSLQTFPYILGWLQANGLPTEPPWPNLSRFPLITLMNALSFRLVGVSDLGAVLPGGILFASMAAVVFLLGNRLAGPLAGLLAAILSVSSTTQLNYSLSGLTATGVAFFIGLSALLFVSTMEKQQPSRRTLILGLVLGLAFLHRSHLVVLAVAGGLLLLAFGERKVSRVALLLGGFLLVLSPWLVRNYLVAGSPSANLTNDRALLHGIVPGDLFLSFEQYESVPMVADNLDTVARKFRNSTKRFLSKGWADIFGPEFFWLGPAFLLCGFFRLGRHLRAVWLFALGSFLIASFIVLASWLDIRYFRPFAPLLLCVVCSAAVRWSARLPGGFRIVSVTLALLLVGTTAAHLTDRAGRRPPKAPASQPIFDSLRSLVPPGTVVASNASWKIAWYCDRPSVRFLGNVAQLQMLDRDFTRVGAVFMQGKRAAAFASQLAKSPMVAEFRVARSYGDRATLWTRVAPDSN